MKRLFDKIAMVMVCWGVLASTALGHNLYLPVIVDTDMGSDDARAIIMLLNSGSVDARLMVTSDGVLAPDTGQENLIGLLAALHRPDVPTAQGTSLALEAPEFRRMNESLAWPKASPPEGKDRQDWGDAPRAIIRAVQSADGDCLYLCLGPMTNLAMAMKADPTLKSRIHTVVYLGNSPHDSTPGWNTRRDMASAAAVYDSGIKIVGLGFPDAESPVFDKALLEKIKAMETPSAAMIAHIHDTPGMAQTIGDGHMRVWDEMTVIYLNRPDIFQLTIDEQRPNSQRMVGFDPKAVEKTYLKLLGNASDFHLDERNSVVLETFPTDPGLMRKDVADHVAATIARHGLEEWKACLLTNELHRHLGIYSLVGAKMGIRAREILNAPFDSLKVISLAGLKPPLSCMNDGLQVSTGASLGRGAIRVQEDEPGPSAKFIHNGTTFKLTLKPEYVSRIRNDIKQAIQRYGGLGPEYFAHIRKLSIDYWYEFDRNLLFDEQMVR